MFRLARSLGMTVRELELKLTTDEFYEWQAFDRMEPLGNETMEYILASLCAIVGNMFSGKNAKLLKPSDFIPRWTSEEKKEQTPQEMRRVLMAVTESHNKRLEKKKNKAEKRKK